MTYYISNIARSKGDPKVLHTGPSSLAPADRMAKALGWFSIALGLTELIAAKRITRWAACSRAVESTSRRVSILRPR